MTKKVIRPGQDDKIELPIRGRSVSRCYVDSAFGVQFFEGEEEVTIRIECPFRLTYSGTEWVLSPERLVELGRALVIMWKTVKEATAFQDGSLELIFDDGIRLSVTPDPDYEAWEIVAPNGFRVVCMPGGGLAVWAAQ